MPHSSSKTRKILTAYQKIGNELITLRTLPELLDKILEITREVFHFDNAVMRLVNNGGATLEVAASYGYPPEVLEQPLNFGQGIMGRAAANGTPVVVSEVSSDPDYLPGIPSAHSAVVVPMVVQDRLVGVFNVESVEPNAFSEDDIEVLQTMTAQAASAIENARMYEEMEQMSERYRMLHQFNQRILDSTSLGIYTLDSSLCITSWNRWMEQVSGMEEARVLGRPLLTLFPELLAERFDRRLNKVLSSGESERMELVHQDVNGKRRVQKRRLSPLLDGDTTIGVVIIVDDITEFQGLLDQIIESEKLAEVGRLSSGIAHEINNPLAVIAYAAQLLGRETDPGSFSAELLEQIESEIERLKSLTTGLLGFSRNSKAELSRVDCNEVIRQVLTLIKYEVRRAGHSIDEQLGEIEPVLADANQVKQVCINLITNAVQAMKDPGTITLRTCVHAGKEVQIHISDTGPGIEQEEQEKIFTPFFTTKPEGEGTGLGLYLCRKIAQEHNGDILFKSKPGQGSTFTFVIPMTTFPSAR
ncbi:MAG: ATP-binding protein [Desulfuromonadaceae bacterium]